MTPDPFLPLPRELADVVHHLEDGAVDEAAARYLSLTPEEPARALSRLLLWGRLSAKDEAEAFAERVVPELPGDVVAEAFANLAAFRQLSEAWNQRHPAASAAETHRAFARCVEQAT